MYPYRPAPPIGPVHRCSPPDPSCCNLIILDESDSELASSKSTFELAFKSAFELARRESASELASESASQLACNARPVQNRLRPPNWPADG